MAVNKGTTLLATHNSLRASRTRPVLVWHCHRHPDVQPSPSQPVLRWNIQQPPPEIETVGGADDRPDEARRLKRAFLILPAPQNRRRPPAVSVVAEPGGISPPHRYQDVTTVHARLRHPPASKRRGGSALHRSDLITTDGRAATSNAVGDPTMRWVTFDLMPPRTRALTFTLLLSIRWLRQRTPPPSLRLSGLAH